MSDAGRVLGIDLGSKRIGLAMSDAGRVLASPHKVLLRAAKPSEDHRTIAALVDEWEITTAVVGLPLSLDGSVGPAAARARKEIAALRTALDIPVEEHDERFTTVTAHEMLKTLDMKGEQRRHVVDKVAAAVLLQAWLDRRRSLDHHGAVSGVELAATEPTSFQHETSCQGVPDR